MTREEKMAVIDGLAEQLNQYPHFYITNIEALNAEQTVRQGTGEGGEGRD